MSNDVVEVRMWGRRVGAIARDPQLGCYIFGFAPEWLATGVDLAPLMMPAKKYAPPGFAFPHLSKLTYQGLPGLLADALPDDFGNALVDAWMAARGTTRDQITTLDRLAYMGKRAMGALEFRPAVGSHRPSQKPIAMKGIVEAARKVIRGDLTNDREAQTALANIIQVGASAGGARAKAVVAWNPQNDEIRSGQFDVSPGFEHWLIKFDGVGLDKELGTGADYGRIEYAYYLMAKSAGIGMSPSRLLHENGRAHFMTYRFDRDGNIKHHLQSLCAMAHLDYRQRATHAYAQLFITARELGLGDDALDQLFRRMVFNVFARNCDDHTKNFAFLLKENSTWTLTPAYDVTHAYNPLGEWTYQHLMSVNSKFDEITRQDLLEEAARFQIRYPSQIIADVAAAINSWGEFAKEAGVRVGEIERVATHLVLH